MLTVVYAKYFPLPCLENAANFTKLNFFLMDIFSWIAFVCLKNTCTGKFPIKIIYLFTEYSIYQQYIQFIILQKMTD